MEKIEEIKKENNDSVSLPKENAVSAAEDTKSSKKDRKPFAWTEKRLEAFKKMREGLDTKNEIAKEIKAEKKKSEKDEIKKRIREIMSSSKSTPNKVKPPSSDSEDSNSEPVAAKKMSKKAIAAEQLPKSSKAKSKRAVVEVQADSSEEEEESEDSDASEEKIVMTKKQYEAMQASKKNVGKAPRSAVLYKPSDQFILL